MPAGDKAFQDLIDSLEVASEAFGVGYWKGQWDDLATEIHRNIKKLCDTHRTTTGFSSTCKSECPFIEEDGSKSMLCLRLGLLDIEYIHPMLGLRGQHHPKCNPSFKVLVKCAVLDDYTRGLMSEILAIYHVKLPPVRQTKLSGHTGKMTKRFKVVDRPNGSVDAVVQPSASYTADDVLSDANTWGVLTPTMYQASVTAGTATPTPVRRWICSECGFDAADFDHLSGHLAEHHNLYLCEYCGSQYASREQLEAHCESVHMEWTCDRCDAAFAAEDDLRAHIDEEHAGFQCAVCGHEFMDQEDLDAHIALTHGDDDGDGPEEPDDTSNEEDRR